MTISQKLPENFEEKLQKFQAFIIAERKKYKYKLYLIGNADQTPLTFDMPANSTVDLKGKKNSVNHDNWSRKRSLHSDASLPRKWNRTSPLCGF